MRSLLLDFSTIGYYNPLVLLSIVERCTLLEQLAEILRQYPVHIEPTDPKISEINRLEIQEVLDRGEEVIFEPRPFDEILDAAVLELSTQFPDWWVLEPDMTSPCHSRMMYEDGRIRLEIDSDSMVTLSLEGSETIAPLDTDIWVMGQPEDNSRTALTLWLDFASNDGELCLTKAFVAYVRPDAIDVEIHNILGQQMNLLEPVVAHARHFIDRYEYDPDAVEEVETARQFIAAIAA